jgi:hypothetical protein
MLNLARRDNIVRHASPVMSVPTARDLRQSTCPNLPARVPRLEGLLWGGWGSDARRFAPCGKGGSRREREGRGHRPADGDGVAG